MPQAHGRPCWYDLMTSDTAGAKAFYGEVFNWTTNYVEPPMDYTMWAIPGQEMPFGGLETLPAEAKAMGAPNHWLAYFNVDDVDTTAALAEELGGRVLMSAKDIPDAGRFAVIADPQGAAFALFTSTRDAPEDEQKSAGSFCWHELNSTDGVAAQKFYVDLFGWAETASFDMGPELGVYWMFGLRGATYGGMSGAAKVTGAPPHWLLYVQVADVDEAAARVKAQGGAVLNGPMDVPGGGRVAQCYDPQGAAFGVSQPAPAEE